MNTNPNHATADGELRDRIAEALFTTRRTDYEGKADHLQHRYDARCALCAYDVDALTDAVLAVLLPSVCRARVLHDAALSGPVRQFLTFALDLAADEMASRGDEFGADDEAALAGLRRLAAEQPTNTETPEATFSGRIARLVAKDAEALRMGLYDDVAAYARQTGNTGLQHAQIRDHLTEFLFEGLLRRAVAVVEQPDTQTREAGQ